MGLLLYLVSGYKPQLLSVCNAQELKNKEGIEYVAKSREACKKWLVQNMSVEVTIPTYLPTYLLT